MSRIVIRLRIRPRLLIPVLFLASAAPLAGQDSAARLDRARALMREVPLIDGHNDLPWQMRERAGGDFDSLDIALPQDSLHTDLARLREGLVGGQFFVAYVPSELIADGATRFALMQIDLIHRMVERYPEAFTLARTADEIEAAHRAGKVAAIVSIEGGHAIEGSLDVLRTFYDLGARYMTLTHWQSHAWADAATDDPRHQGLSPFGEQVVREMNRLGMLVDLSHVSDSTMADAMRISEAPVIYSHSSARAVTDHPRNVPDPLLEMLAEDDGVVMVNFAPGFVSEEVKAWSAAADSVGDALREEFGDDTTALRAGVSEWREAHPAPKATLAQVADHVDHLIAVAGADHVGIGSDYDGIDDTPAGLDDISTFPALIAELLRRGHSEEDLKKILGLNLLRVLREAEAVAARLQQEMKPIVATIDPEIEPEEPDE